MDYYHYISMLHPFMSGWRIRAKILRKIIVYMFPKNVLELVMVNDNVFVFWICELLDFFVKELIPIKCEPVKMLV